MTRFFLVPVLLLLIASPPAFAQQDDKVSEAMIEEALEQIGVGHERQAQAYVFTLQQWPLELRRLQQGSRLLVKVRFKETPSLEAINRYNEEVAVTTRAVRYVDHGLVLEAGLDGYGASAEVVRRFIYGFLRDAKAFDKFLADHREPAPSTGKPGPFPLVVTAGTDDKEVEISFPTKEAAPGETAWRIEWDILNAEEANKEGFRFPENRKSAKLIFRIKKAYYRPGPKAPWLQVLEDVHASEFYVPYYFQNTRFFDLRDVGAYASLHKREGGAHSRLLGKDRRVMAELRDQGIVYKHGARSRRGEELVLWANFVAGNYTYLVEYCFQDDGTVLLKHAPTGYNYFAHFDEAAHMHNVLWRIGLKLGPDQGSQPTEQQVQLVKLPFEPKALGPQGKLSLSEITQESYHDWNAKEFTQFRVTNPKVSLFPKDPKKPARPISYDIVASMNGQARHYRHKDEGFSEHDFWVTRADCPEKMYVNIHEYFRGKMYNGSKSSPQPLQGSDGVVFWHMSSVLHVPRGEDGIYYGTSSNNGQALASWTCLELRPRNLFVKTPLYREK